MHFLKKRGKLSLSEQLEQAQKFLETEDSEERKWVSTQKNKDRDFKAQTRKVKQKGFEKQNGSQDKNTEQREFKHKNQFKSNQKFYENKREGED